MICTMLFLNRLKKQVYSKKDATTSEVCVCFVISVVGSSKRNNKDHNLAFQSDLGSLLRRSIN